MMKKCNPRGFRALGEELLSNSNRLQDLRRANSAFGVGNVLSEVAAALAGAFVVRGAV